MECFVLAVVGEIVERESAAAVQTLVLPWCYSRQLAVRMELSVLDWLTSAVRKQLLVRRHLVVVGT